MPVQGALQHHAQQPGHDHCKRQRCQKRHTPFVELDDAYIAAHHGEYAMRQIGEIHQAQRDRQADTDEKQQHAKGNAIKDNRHGSHTGQ